jgi:hypothetical protein
MLKIIVESFKDYFRSKYLLLISIAIGLLAFILFYIIPDSVFFSVLGVFIRISKVAEVSLLELLFLMLVYTIFSFLLSLIFFVTVVKVKELRTSYIRYEIVKDIWQRRFADLFMFFLSLFFIHFALSVFSYTNSIDLTLLQMIIFYILFFVPYAMIIDDVGLFEAFKTIYRFKKDLFLYPIFHAIVIGLIINLLVFLLKLFLETEIVRIVLFWINTIFLIPFAIILGANLYMQKYKLSIKII